MPETSITTLGNGDAWATGSDFSWSNELQNVTPSAKDLKVRPSFASLGCRGDTALLRSQDAIELRPWLAYSIEAEKSLKG